MPFAHKGKVATVHFFGQIGRKHGDWVGVELEADSGDCDGFISGQQFFQVEKNHGLFCRVTQVRPYDPNAKPTATQARATRVGVPTLPIPTSTPKDNADEFEGDEDLLASPTKAADAQPATAVKSL